MLVGVACLLFNLGHAVQGFLHILQLLDVELGFFLLAHFLEEVLKVRGYFSVVAVAISLQEKVLFSEHVIILAVKPQKRTRLFLKSHTFLFAVTLFSSRPRHSWIMLR